MATENVAVVKASWAGWRQSLPAQMTRDVDEQAECELVAPLPDAGARRGPDGMVELTRMWAAAEPDLDLTPEDFVDADDAVLVRARAQGSEGSRTLWFRYTMHGKTIAGWHVFASEDEARAGTA